MPNLKDLKNRIASVKSTRKITKAMQMVAAAKLRRAQEAAEASRPYTERFNAVLGGLAAFFAHGQDFHGFAFGQKRLSVLFCQLNDVGVEAAAKPALGRHDDEHMNFGVA